MKYSYVLSLILVATMLAACSGGGTATNSAGNNEIDPVAVDLSGTETFDTGKYEINPPPAQGAIEHDVPEALMSGAEDENKSLRNVAGFRIQIHSSLDKNEAVAKEQQVTLWWRTVDASQRPAGLGGKELPVYLHFQQPYYRVRIGNFGNRNDAEEALALVQDAFPNAFIAVDTVSIYR